MKDPTGDALKAIRIKYPFLGRQDTKDLSQLKAEGGRIGMAEGGIMDLGGMEKDYRAEGGFVPIGRGFKSCKYTCRGRAKRCNSYHATS